MPIPDYDINTYADDHDEWVQRLSKMSRCDAVETIDLNTPISSNCVRFVCLSDTHSKLDELISGEGIPDGDVLIHSGDFTNFGDRDELLKFNDQIGLLPHRFKIVIAGNHEIGFEDGDTGEKWLDMFIGRGTPSGYDLLKNATYLQDKSVQVFGLTIYGSSWHSLPGYPFYRERGAAIAKQWKNIPDNVDVLITHSPPLGYLDDWKNGRHWGCVELLKAVQNRVHPKFHVFGHVHERNAAVTDGDTIFVNASICSHKLKIKNRPRLFDIPLPIGAFKTAI